MTIPESAHYRIAHRTHYRYASMVAICQNQLRMMPRSFTRRMSGLECHQVETWIDPEPTVLHEHTDYYGNRVLSFAIESLHQELTVMVNSEVTVHQTGDVLNQESPAWESIVKRIKATEDRRWLIAQEYQFDSPRITLGPTYEEYARQSFTPGRPLVEAGIELTKRIHDDFKYDVTATDVNTTTDRAFELRAGVCQDFAHVQIACLRSIGIPARYISGYLRTVPPPGEPRLVGADESHAWISMYAGDALGWLDMDPTNACPANTNHIPICLGRDYSEVTPMRGVVLGGGATKLSVSVDVAPI